MSHNQLTNYCGATPGDDISISYYLLCCLINLCSVNLTAKQPEKTNGTLSWCYANSLKCNTFQATNF